jgi:hypothetical protein
VTDEDLQGEDRHAVLFRVACEAGLCVDDIEDVEDGEELQELVSELVEERYGCRTIGAWLESTEPLRSKRRHIPVPGVDRLEPTEKWRQTELEEAAVDAMRLACTLGRDPLAMRAPLELELEYALKLSELMEEYRRRWKAEARRTTVPMLFHELSRLYAWVAGHWPRRKPRSSTATRTPLTQRQREVLAAEEKHVRDILTMHGRHLGGFARLASVVPKLVLDGPSIRAHGGSRDAASASLSLLAGLRERAIQNTLNEVRPIDFARFNHRLCENNRVLVDYLRQLLGEPEPRTRRSAPPRRCRPPEAACSSGATACCGRIEEARVLDCCGLADERSWFYYVVRRRRMMPADGSEMCWSGTSECCSSTRASADGCTA